MVKYQKLAIAPDGAIVFRSTGKIATGNLAVKDNRVYKNGRLYGYIGKPTKTQLTKIERVAQSPTRKHRAKVVNEVERIRKEGIEIPALPDVKTSANIRKWLSAVSLTGDAVKYLHNSIGIRGEVEISKVTQSRLNYAKVIKKAIDSGKISPVDGDKMIEAMYKASDHATRIKLWNDTAQLFEQLGFKYEIHSRIKDHEE